VAGWAADWVVGWAVGCREWASTAVCDRHTTDSSHRTSNTATDLWSSTQTDWCVQAPRQAPQQARGQGDHLGGGDGGGLGGGGGGLGGGEGGGGRGGGGLGGGEGGGLRKAEAWSMLRSQCCQAVA
jgi:hypothetical protein